MSSIYCFILSTVIPVFLASSSFDLYLFDFHKSLIAFRFSISFKSALCQFSIKDFSNAYDFRFASLRYFNASGADPECEIGEWHNPETHLIPLILDAAIGAREDIKIFGTDYDTPDGTCIRDYIHVNDLAEAHILALEKMMKDNKNLIYNLGNGNGFSVREIIDIAKNVTGKDFKVCETDRREGDPAILIASSEKARKELGWNPRYDSPELIIKTAWEWHKKLYKEYKK